MPANVDIGFVMLTTANVMGAMFLYASYAMGFPRLPYFTKDDRISNTILIELDLGFYLFLCFVVLLSFGYARSDIFFATCMYVMLRTPHYALVYRKIYKARRQVSF